MMLQSLAFQQALSLGPKHTMPFSVSDILSPIEETHKKFGDAKAGAPRPTSSRAATMAGKRQPHVMAGHSAAATAARYHIPPGISQFRHRARGGYCNGGQGNMGELPAYPEGLQGGGAAATCC